MMHTVGVAILMCNLLVCLPNVPGYGIATLCWSSRSLTHNLHKLFGKF